MTEKTSQDIVPVENWSALAQTLGSENLPLPFITEIFLIDSNIAGTGYVENIQAKTDMLTSGMLLEFKREPSNPYDTRAILVLNDKGEKIGYVPHANNEILSRLMDAGKLIYGKVKEKELVGKWLKIAMEIYMRDI